MADHDSAPFCCAAITSKSAARSIIFSRSDSVYSGLSCATQQGPFTRGTTPNSIGFPQLHLGCSALSAATAASAMARQISLTLLSRAIRLKSSSVSDDFGMLLISPPSLLG